MKRIFIMLLLLTDIIGQAARAETRPADSSDTSQQPAETTQDSDAGSAAPKEGQGKGKAEDEEEPDCE